MARRGAQDQGLLRRVREPHAERTRARSRQARATAEEIRKPEARSQNKTIQSYSGFWLPWLLASLKQVVLVRRLCRLVRSRRDVRARNDVFITQSRADHREDARIRIDHHFQECRPVKVHEFL